MWLFTREMQALHHQKTFELPWWKRKHFQIMTKRNGKFKEEKRWRVIDFIRVKARDKYSLEIYRWILKIGNLRICRFWWRGNIDDILWDKRESMR